MDTNGNPNPSPFPPSNSPNVAGAQRRTSYSSISSRTTIPAVTEMSRGPHHQVSPVGLDAAYNRLRQVRRSLLELPQSLPVAISQLSLHVPEVQVALGHDAGTSPEFPSPSAVGQRERFGDREGATLGRIHSAVQNDRVPSDVPLVENFSLSVDRRQPARPSPGLPHNDLPTNQTGTFTGSALEDDGSTLLGRRVAARLAVVSSTGAMTNRNRSTIEVYERAVDSIISASRRYEAELEMLGRIMEEGGRLPTTGPSRTVSHSSPAFAHSSQDRHHASPHQSPRGASQTPQAPQDFSQHPQRDLGAAIDHAQNLGPSERFAFLSNFAAQISPTPSNSVPDRPLILDEPLNYVSSELDDPISESRRHSSESAFQGRNYVVHRTYNRDGEELVHNITIDWGDRDTSSWLMPSPNTSRRHRNRFSSGGRQDFDVFRSTDPVVPLPLPLPPTAPAPESAGSNDPPRRRGWARLDLDGNEIPSDEEEQLERMRTENRLRGLQHPQTLVQAARIMSLPVSLPQQELRVFQHTNPSAVLRHDPSLSYPADFLNPLPMPLSEMIESGKTSKPKAILLPRHIILAGR